MKRIITLIISIALFTATFTVGAYTVKQYNNGDVNRDGNVNVKDATVIQEYVAKMRKFDPMQEKLADVNLDSFINVKDATLVQKVIAKLDVMPDEGITTPSDTVKPTETQQPTQTVTETVTQKPTETQPATSPDDEIVPKVTIYYRDSLNWSKVYYYLYSSDGKKQAKDWPGVTPAEGSTSAGIKTYKYDVDVSEFDRVVFTNGTDKSMDVPLSIASTGFTPKSGTKGKDGKYVIEKYRAGKMIRGKLTTTTLEYSSGYNKKIWIYTPADYSETSDRKFPTIYMTDGQNLFSDHKDGHGGWDVEGAVDGLLANTGKSAIVVGIDNGNNKRDSELTPNIGAINSAIPAGEAKNYQNGTGKAFSEFVVNKVMPYVRENYKSSDKREENCVCGSSSGGLEAFYIGMENKDKFGTIGALSPAFLLFDDTVWNNYLKKFTLTDSSIPKLYLYCGNNDSLEKDLYTFTNDMHKRLLKKGFPQDKLVYSIFEPGIHNEQWWRMYFPEVLTLFFAK